MADQEAGPISDVSNDGWTTAPLWSNLDEATPNDSDIINSPVGTEISPRDCVMGLASVTDPVVHTGHVLKVRMQASHAGLFDAYLLQSGTQISTWAVSIDTTLTTYELSVTTGEAANITNYGALQVKLRKRTSLTAGYFITCSWARLFCPSAPFAHLDISAGGLVNAAAASGNYLTLSGGGLLRVTGTETAGALILSGGDIKVQA